MEFLNISNSDKNWDVTNEEHDEKEGGMKIAYRNKGRRIVVYIVWSSQGSNFVFIFQAIPLKQDSRSSRRSTTVQGFADAGLASSCSCEFLIFLGFAYVDQANHIPFMVTIGLCMLTGNIKEPA